jgi:hypothetical protein
LDNKPAIKPCLTGIGGRDVDWIELARYCPIKTLTFLRVKFGKHNETRTKITFIK